MSKKKKKYYHIQKKVNNSWYSPISGQYVILSFWKGWIAAIKEYYPSQPHRLVNAETGEIVEDVSGNNKVSLNTE